MGLKVEGRRESALFLWGEFSILFLVPVSKKYFRKRITDLDIIFIFTYNLKPINMNKKKEIIKIIFTGFMIAFGLILGVAFLDMLSS